MKSTVTKTVHARGYVRKNVSVDRIISVEYTKLEDTIILYTKVH